MPKKVKTKKLKNKIILTTALLAITIAILPVVATLQVPFLQSANATPYSSGYSHGVSDARIGGHDYLDGSGGSGAHTAEFMRGYHAGYSSGGSSGNVQSASHGSGNKLLCYAAGGVLLLAGVPAPSVIAAGSAAHAAGVCP
jgi:hypothetical protein